MTNQEAVEARPRRPSLKSLRQAVGAAGLCTAIALGLPPTARADQQANRPATTRSDTDTRAHAAGLGSSLQLALAIMKAELRVSNRIGRVQPITNVQGVANYDGPGPRYYILNPDEVTLNFGSRQAATEAILYCFNNPTNEPTGPEVVCQPAWDFKKLAPLYEDPGKTGQSFRTIDPTSNGAHTYNHLLNSPTNPANGNVYRLNNGQPMPWGEAITQFAHYPPDGGVALP